MRRADRTERGTARAVLREAMRGGLWLLAGGMAAPALAGFSMGGTPAGMAPPRFVRVGAGLSDPLQQHVFGDTGRLNPSQNRFSAAPRAVTPGLFPGYGLGPMGAGPGYLGQLQGSDRPRIQAHLTGSDRPYVDQPVIYQVDVLSRGGATILNPVLPATDAAVIEQVEGPLTTTQTLAGGYREVVNSYRFAITPLQAGEVRLPAIGMKGRLAATAGWPGRLGGERAFDIRVAQPLALNVRPAQPVAGPWLPLAALRLHGELARVEDVAAGEPLSVTVVQEAVGVGGDALPSVEPQLKEGDYRIYRESTRTERHLSKDGTRLYGRRTETFTLVPLHGGELRLPVVRIAWWNTTTDRPQTATLALDSLVVAGAPDAPPGVSVPAAKGGSLYWLVLAAALGAMLGSWLWLWAREKGLGRRLLAGPRRFGRALAERLGPPLRRRGHGLYMLWRHLLTPGHFWQNLRYRLVLIMPARVKLWMCSRCIQQEEDPGDWCELFKFLACKHLKVPHQTPLREIADRIVDVHGGVEPSRLHGLVRELDGALYGGRTLDFRAWKTAFRRELRPRLFRRRRGQGRRQHLPSLNPHHR